MSNTMDLRTIIGKTDNLYKAVVIAAKRARRIHDKLNSELKKQLGEIENEEDLDEELVDREKIVEAYDKKDKPSILALKELIEDKLHYRFKDEEE